MEVPICNNCKYKSTVFGLAMCSRPTGKTDVITGKPATLYRGCSVERLHDDLLGITYCGPTGRFFVQNISWWYNVKQKVKQLVNK